MEVLLLIVFNLHVVYNNVLQDEWFYGILVYFAILRFYI